MSTSTRSHPARTTAELVRQVRRIELKTRKLVDSRFSGEYLSSFKGQGIEFAEVREYHPGDDVRTIDWNVTARLGEPFVKRYIEERELSVLLLVDLSGSAGWGTRTKLKSHLLAEVATTLAMSAVRNQDRVALLIATDRVERFVPPGKGKRHVLRIIRDLLAFEVSGRRTDLTPALTFAQRVLPHRALIFLFSDFQLGESWEPFGKALARLRVQHDVVAGRLTDPRDGELPDVGMLRVADPESGSMVLLDSSNRRAREHFALLAKQDHLRAGRLFNRLGIDEISLHTDRDYTPALVDFFRRRGSRRR